MAPLPGSWIATTEAYIACHSNLAQAVFAAIVETIPPVDRAEYERVLDASLANAAGDREVAMGYWRHQVTEEPQVATLHARLEQRYLLIMDQVRVLVELGDTILPRCSP